MLFLQNLPTSLFVTICVLLAWYTPFIEINKFRPQSVVWDSLRSFLQWKLVSQFKRKIMFCDFKFNLMWNYGVFMVVILFILSNFMTFDLMKGKKYHWQSCRVTCLTLPESKWLHILMKMVLKIDEQIRKLSLISWVVSASKEKEKVRVRSDWKNNKGNTIHEEFRFLQL